MLPLLGEAQKQTMGADLKARQRFKAAGSALETISKTCALETISKNPSPSPNPSPDPNPSPNPSPNPNQVRRAAQEGAVPAVNRRSASRE